MWRFVSSKFVDGLQGLWKRNTKKKEEDILWKIEKKTPKHCFKEGHYQDVKNPFSCKSKCY